MTKQAILFLLCGAMAFGCGDDDATTDAGPPPADASMADGDMTPDVGDSDGGPDAGPPPGPDAGPPPDPTCENLCAAAMESCDGNLAAYASMAECMTWCDDVDD
jgi:hypothetical protein